MPCLSNRLGSLTLASGLLVSSKKLSILAAGVKANSIRPGCWPRQGHTARSRIPHDGRELTSTAAGGNGSQKPISPKTLACDRHLRGSCTCLSSLLPMVEISRRTTRNQDGLRSVLSRGYTATGLLAVAALSTAVLSPYFHFAILS
jgi:hypothetical protein